MYVLRIQYYQVADLDAGLFRRFLVVIFFPCSPFILLGLFRLSMYVLYLVSIHCRPGFMSFSLCHLIRLWVKPELGKNGLILYALVAKLL